MDENLKVQGGPIKPIKINEIGGLWTYLENINWTEPWFCGLGIFHVTCVILTILTRKAGAIQSVYFGVLLLLVFCAEHINQWAAENWGLFAHEQYFDSNGLFISIVFSTPLLINCLVIVVYWLWDVGMLISDVKRLKIGKRSLGKPESSQSVSDEQDNTTDHTEECKNDSVETDSPEDDTESEKKNK